MFVLPLHQCLKVRLSRKHRHLPSKSLAILIQYFLQRKHLATLSPLAIFYRIYLVSHSISAWSACLSIVLLSMLQVWRRKIWRFVKQPGCGFVSNTILQTWEALEWKVSREYSRDGPSHQQPTEPTETRRIEFSSAHWAHLLGDEFPVVGILVVSSFGQWSIHVIHNLEDLHKHRQAQASACKRRHWHDRTDSPYLCALR